MNLPLADEAERSRFVQELDRNFSVIAPAGVGKTTAIARRVVAWLRRSAPEDFLKNFARDRALPHALLVVTYTEKAARELEQRVRQWLESSGAAHGVSPNLSSVFFGTIHALAGNFLRDYGASLGLAPDFREPRDRADPQSQKLWHNFLCETPRLLDFVPPELLNALRSDHRLTELLSLVPEAPDLQERSFLLREKSAGPPDLAHFPPPPSLHFDAALQFQAQGNARENIMRFQKRLQDWCDAEEPEPLPLPETKSQKFLAVLLPEMQERWRWSERLVRAVLSKIQECYLQYRIREGQLFYDDLIALAHRCMGEETIAPNIPVWRVILDEAQDTDFYQFEWLLSLASAQRCPQKFPEPGYFCMVGDPQQSIYSERAALQTYLELHRRLVAEKKAEELTFSVTLRCPQALIHFVNAHFPKILTGCDGQAPFVPLRAKANASQGHCYRWLIPTDSVPEEAILKEARIIAKVFQHRTPADFGAQRWSDIAFLCPRKKWLTELAWAFQSLPDTPDCQRHSPEATCRDSPLYAWMTALVAVSLDPRNDFEMTGILREIFGISDARIAHYFALQAADPEIRSICEGFAKDRAAILSYSPVQLLEYLRQRYQVVERLEAIFERNFAAEYEQLLAHAREATGRALTLDVWLEELLLLLDRECPEDVVRPEALQFLTFHKAKGLEWPIVVLPFMHRDCRDHVNSYPRCLLTPEGPRIVFNRHHMPEFEEEQKLHQRQNEERLLYVAMTRARECCILVHDGSLFPPKKNSGSTAQILASSGTGASGDFWKNLEEWPLPSAG